MPPNFKKVFSVFSRNYELVPLEAFKRDPYKTLVSTILSSRTKDEVTYLASKRLFRIAPNIKYLLKLSESNMRKAIFPVGFYKTKAKHLKKLAKLVLNDYYGKIPDTKVELMKLPGVGLKTANLVLNRAFEKPAIAVDTHVHKIVNFLGWVKTKTPEATEKELTKILPRKYWSEINRLFVSIGRKYKTPKKVRDFLEKEGLI